MTFGYLTRNALVLGIRKIEMLPHPRTAALVRDANYVSGQYYILGVEVFEDPAEAVRDAERLRFQRIARVEREVLRLKTLRFQVPG